jgi:uncharacterized membrane protein
MQRGLGVPTRSIDGLFYSFVMCQVSDLTLWLMTTVNGMQLLFSSIAGHTMVRGSRPFHRSSISMYDYIQTENAFFRSFDFPLLGYLFARWHVLIPNQPGMLIECLVNRST